MIQSSHHDSAAASAVAAYRDESQGKPMTSMAQDYLARRVAWGTPMVDVLADIERAAYERGHAAGYRTGREDGRVIGYAKGHRLGLAVGWRDAIAEIDAQLRAE